MLSGCGEVIGGEAIGAGFTKAGTCKKRCRAAFYTAARRVSSGCRSVKDYFFLLASLIAFCASAAFSYFFVKRSTRPAVSSSFCLPVKKGWQFEQISTRSKAPLIVERVGNVCPQAQCTVTGW